MGSNAMPKRYGKEDDWGTVFLFGELGQLRQAWLLPSLLLLPTTLLLSSPGLGMWLVKPPVAAGWIGEGQDTGLGLL